MITDKVTYQKDYKYQAIGETVFHTDFILEKPIKWKRLSLSVDGVLTVADGYCWDGCSGPVIDRRTNMRASLCHDSLYQLMRMGFLDFNLWRMADFEFAKILKQDKAWPITIMIDILGLKLANGASAHPRNRKLIYLAPK